MSAGHDAPVVSDMVRDAKDIQNDEQEDEPGPFEDVYKVLDSPWCMVVDILYDPCRLLNPSREPEASLAPPLNAEMRATYQQHWDKINSDGPFCYSHPAVGCLCLKGWKYFAWLPEWCPKGVSHPTCGIGEAITAGRGEKPYICGMGSWGLSACCCLACCTTCPCYLGGVSLVMHRRIIKRYGLRIRKSQGLNMCNHPCLVCCCYPLTSWKHSMFTIAIRIEHKALLSEKGDDEKVDGAPTEKTALVPEGKEAGKQGGGCIVA